jgi:hypothetical protein
MTPAEIVRHAAEGGVTLKLSPSGTIRAAGDTANVERWLPLVRARKTALISALSVSTTSRHWLLHFAELEPLEVHFHPDASFTGVMERYPDALAAEPMPARTRRPPTESEAVELRVLVRAVGKAGQWTADEFEWATAAALDDPDQALACFRALVAELPL